MLESKEQSPKPVIKEALESLTNVSVQGLDYDTIEKLVAQYREIIDDKVKLNIALKNQMLQLQSEKINLEETVRRNTMQIEALKRITIGAVPEKQETSFSEIKEEIKLEDIV